MIKIGQIGTAHIHGEGKMDCIRKFPDTFELVGVAEESPESIKSLKSDKRYYGIPVMSFEELLNYPGLDAVMVETEELKLVETAQRAVDKGLHVHIDKPAGTDIAALKALLKTAKSKGLTVQMAYMYRYNPAVKYCLDMVKNGELGEIYRVDAVMNSFHPPERRLWVNRFPGGNMFFLGCHMVDLVLLFKGVPERIIQFNKSSGIENVNALDQGFAVFEYKNGISTVQATQTECSGYDRRQLVVCGDKGTVEIKPLEVGGLPTSLLSIAGERCWNGAYTEKRLPDATGRYDAMMLDFAEMAEGNKENPFTYEYELLLQQAVLTACGQPTALRSASEL